MRSTTVNINPLFPILACVCCLAFAAPAGHSTDFSGGEVGKVPQDMQVVNGAFAVAQFNGDKVLELPGDPLDTFGVLFGPPDQVELTVAARAQGESSGRRHPEFGVGAGDVAGFRLMFLPGQKRVELRKGDDPVASADYGWRWASGSWTELRLRVRKTADGSWKVEGKAWRAGDPEPQQWAVSVEEKDQPTAGRASLWAVPFSGKPIRFDNLSATPAGS